jgi:hypothetical protein
MTRIQILQEIEKLTAAERIKLIGAALKTLDERPPAKNHYRKTAELRQRLMAAARALRKDYEQAGELTSFTALDAERFHA